MSEKKGRTSKEMLQANMQELRKKKGTCKKEPGLLTWALNSCIEGKSGRGHGAEDLRAHLYITVVG